MHRADGTHHGPPSEWRDLLFILTFMAVGAGALMLGLLIAATTP